MQDLQPIVDWQEDVAELLVRQLSVSPCLAEDLSVRYVVLDTEGTLQEVLPC